MSRSMYTNIKLIAELRRLTGADFSLCRSALIQTEGDMTKALRLLTEGKQDPDEPEPEIVD